MSTKPSLFFVGGFLGAGKTTAINSLAFLLSQRGRKVAVITNDQAEGLVDTYFLSGCGVPAEEVAGSCFCCNFPGLVEAIKHSVETVAPDVILAEPVGSCTDIVATVLRPMRSLMGDAVDVKAYSVLVEPDRWTELGSNAGSASWSMQFLFDKQLEEADYVVVTKVDTLAAEELSAITSQLAARFPLTRVVTISAKKDINVDQWLSLIESTAPSERPLVDLDYGRYAAAEAEMGWLNAQVTLEFAQPADGERIAKALTEQFTEGLRKRGGEIGHLKLLLAGTTGQIKTGITHIKGTIELDGSFEGPVSRLAVTVNARAALSPGDLSATLHETVDGFLKTEKASADISFLTTFRPAPPRPTHRYGS